jgi:hypothetical protein
MRSSAEADASLSWVEDDAQAATVSTGCLVRVLATKIMRSGRFPEEEECSVRL